MNAKSVLRLLILIPYLILGISLLGIYFVHDSSSTILSAFGLLAWVYSLGVIFWGIPYTILVLGLLVWSRKKSLKTIYNALFYSPFLLSILMIGEVVVFTNVIPIRIPTLLDMLNLVWFSFLLVIPSLLFGYLFVGIGGIIYKVLERLKLIKQDIEPSQGHTEIA
jgi:hypothetical protein